MTALPTALYTAEQTRELDRLAIAAGADGLIVEVHPDPETATSDGDQSLDFAEFDAFMDGLRPFVVAVKRGLAARA